MEIEGIQYEKEIFRVYLHKKNKKYFGFILKPSSLIFLEIKKEHVGEKI